jgi:hypothetical protein
MTSSGEMPIVLPTAMAVALLSPDSIFTCIPIPRRAAPKARLISFDPSNRPTPPFLPLLLPDCRPGSLISHCLVYAPRPFTPAVSCSSPVAHGDGDVGRSEGYRVVEPVPDEHDTAGVNGLGAASLAALPTLLRSRARSPRGRNSTSPGLACSTLSVSLLPRALQTGESLIPPAG